MAKLKGKTGRDIYPEMEALKKEGLDTLPKILLRNCKNYGDKVAMRHKDLGIWYEYTWADCYQHIRSFALGLESLGMKRGDRVCIIGDNEPEWFWAEIAVHSMGGIVVGLFTDITPPEMEYFVTHSESTFAVANDQEQTDKFLEIKDKTPTMKKVIYWDPKGMWTYRDNPFVIEFKDVEELGKEYMKEHPSFFEDSIENGKTDDVCNFMYTSGTTGAAPKAAMISYHYFIKSAVYYLTCIPLCEGDEYLSYVSPAWIAEQMFVGSWLVFATRANYIEEPETMRENLREIGPRTIMLGSRLWDSLLAEHQAKMTDSGLLKRLTYELLLPIGYRVADYSFEGKREPPLFWRALYQVANWLCFRPIRDQFGVEHTRTAIAGGALLGYEAYRFFLAIGVKLKSSLGATEILLISGPFDFVRPDSLGPPFVESMVRITDEGEILAKCDMMFQGYYKAPEMTIESLDNGWFRTGDAAFIDDRDGHLVYMDRLKEMVSLKGGGKYSSIHIENNLRFSPYIKDAMVVGGAERDYIIAIINIDFDNVGKWAERNRIPYTTYVDLSQKPEVYDLILKAVKRVNRGLPPAAQLMKYLLLYKEFDPDEGELTRTRKLRRRFMEDRYQQLIEATYNGESQVLAETEVKYRDGRKGKITTTVTIKSVG